MILFSPLRVLLFFAFRHVYTLTLLNWKVEPFETTYKERKDTRVEQSDAFAFVFVSWKFRY